MELLLLVHLAAVLRDDGDRVAQRDTDGIRSIRERLPKLLQGQGRMAELTFYERRLRASARPIKAAQRCARRARSLLEADLDAGKVGRVACRAHRRGEGIGRQAGGLHLATAWRLQWQMQLQQVVQLPSVRNHSPRGKACHASQPAKHA